MMQISGLGKPIAIAQFTGAAVRPTIAEPKAAQRAGGTGKSRSRWGCFQSGGFTGRRIAIMSQKAIIFPDASLYLWIRSKPDVVPDKSWSSAMKSFVLAVFVLAGLGLGIANAEPVGHADPGTGGSPSTWTAGAAGWG